mgnify:CR=1 FL=1
MMTLSRQQELQELETRVEQIANEMVKCALNGRPPAPEQLQSWVHRLARSGFSVMAGLPDVDERPLTIEATLTISRATVETACCLHHAVKPVMGQVFDGVFASIERAHWRIPEGSIPHGRRSTHSRTSALMGRRV